MKRTKLKRKTPLLAKKPWWHRMKPCHCNMGGTDGETCPRCGGRTPCGLKPLRAKNPWGRKLVKQICGFYVGEIVKATHDITAGLFQSAVLCKRGELLRIAGPSGNGLHLIGVTRPHDATWSIAVSATDIERTESVQRLRPFRKGRKTASKAEREYLAWVKTQPCMVCETHFEKQVCGTTEAHHPRINLGMGQKSPHREAFPLGAGHHRPVDESCVSRHGNPAEFQKWYGTDTELRDRFMARPESIAKRKELELE